MQTCIIISYFIHIIQLFQFLTNPNYYSVKNTVLVMSETCKKSRFIVADTHTIS